VSGLLRLHRGGQNTQKGSSSGSYDGGSVNSARGTQNTCSERSFGVVAKTWHVEFLVLDGRSKEIKREDVHIGVRSKKKVESYDRVQKRSYFLSILEN
jgi:hypothetical protein